MELTFEQASSLLVAAFALYESEMRKGFEAHRADIRAMSDFQVSFTITRLSCDMMGFFLAASRGIDEDPETRHLSFDERFELNETASRLRDDLDRRIPSIINEYRVR